MKTRGLLYFVACVAMVIVFSACGGNETGGYKGNFAFLEATRKHDFTLEQKISATPLSHYSKKQETPEQTEILDKMMKGDDKKIAVVGGKTFYNDNLADLSFLNCTAGNEFKPKDVHITITLDLKEFPDAGKPFDRYYAIIDKKGNLARLEGVPGYEQTYLRRIVPKK